MEGYYVQTRTSSKLLEKGAAATSAIPCCNGIIPSWWRKTGLFYFQGILSAKLHKEQGSHASKSFHLPEETGMHPATYSWIRAGELLGEMVSRQLMLSAVFIIAWLYMFGKVLHLGHIYPDTDIE